MSSFELLIILPIIFGFLGYLVSFLRNEFYFLGAILNFYYAVRIFFISRKTEVIRKTFGIFNFGVDKLSGFVLLFISLFTLLILIYSIRYLKYYEKKKEYFYYLLLIGSISCGIVLANNIITLMIFWGILLSLIFGFFQYTTKNNSEDAFIKSIFILGLSDFLLILGFALLFVSYGNIPLNLKISLNNNLNILAYILITIGCFAKAGAIPLHSWIPEISKVMPASTMAFIPASLDKLLGIYLLLKVSYYLFDLNTNFTLKNYLMIVGSITILAAVLMALIQKEAMKLLSFHAVSQVGYMVLGIGTGVPIGVAGSLFHMLNNTLYKTSLFLTTGQVEFWTKETRIEKLGGLAVNMPITFTSFLISALAISGIPPLNGFFSKRMIYQGVIYLYKEGNYLFLLYLLAAMFGSVLTLASFLKLTHSIFLGDRPKEYEKIKEVNFSLWFPSSLLAFLCILFGILAIPLPLKGLIYPSLPFKIEEIGFWQPTLAFILIILGIGIGFVIYMWGAIQKIEKREIFIGGESLKEEERHFSGDQFYSPIKEAPLLSKGFEFGEEGSFDFYNYLKTILGTISLLFKKVIDFILEIIYQTIVYFSETFGSLLRKFQSGILSDYLVVIFIGIVIILLILIL
ncbi:MAG: proton-conducting transporter membrane subunit [candidate division WOR-3 bacterium]|nr:proton-conducting transporter membrane subunit [candidate division WOR-3 bacterium]